MNYWIFKCNPEMYDLEARLHDPNQTITWNVTRYRKEIQKGDVVFLWLTGKNRGVRAIFKVDTPPIEMSEIESEKKYWVTEDKPIRYRVVGTLRKKNTFLPSDEIKNMDGLSNMSIFGYAMALNYPLTEEEGKLLLKMFSDKKDLINA